MTVETEVKEQFTGLILLTGVDKAAVSYTHLTLPTN
jgi:hypothetical protein